MKKNYFKNLMQVSLLLGAAFVISSCDDVIGQEDNPVASYVQWKANTPEEVTLKIGNTYTVQATAVSSAIVVYESENPEIAKVDPVTGVITAVAVGETNVNAVISGMSTTGQSVFTPEKVSIKVIVKDGNAKLTAVKTPVIEYTANVDSVIDLTKLFTAYPEVGTGAQKSSVAYTILGKNDKKTPAAQDLATINAAEVKILANGTIRDWYAVNKKKGTDISDTLYVEATLTPNDTKEYKVAKPTDVVDTIMVIINKSIAFINKDGKREILTADKYKTPDFSTALEAGTYYVSANDATGDIAIKGDVNLIFADKVTLTETSISDQTDNATLNIFGEAIDLATPAKGKYIASNPTITINAGTNGDAISNFKEINFYTGAITATTSKANSGAIVKVKNLNVFGGTLTATNAASGYAISLLEGGKLTIKGGSVTATGKGSDTDRSYGVIGDVEVAKGTFEATSDYRAVKGSLTAGEGLEFVESNTPTVATSWTKIEGTTSNAKGVKSQAKK